jgi:cytochrome c55X
MPDLLRTRACLLLGIVVVAGVVAGAAGADVGPEDAARLQHLVAQDCGSCHGLTRKGGLGSPLTRDALAGAAPEVLATIILDGVPGTAMPPWRPLLSPEEARWIADYLMTEQAE